jgi:predicted ATP-grasp superfamily ATP-dependent carboligase
MRGLTDVPAATQAIWNGTLRPLAYLGSFRPPIEFAIFAPDDPLPAVVDAPLLLKRTVSRFWRGRQRLASGKALGIAAVFCGVGL